MNKIDDILEQLKGQQPVIDDPDALTDRIMDSLPDMEPAADVRRQNRRTQTVPLWRWLSIAASILFIIGIGTTLMHRQDAEPKTEALVAKIESEEGGARNELSKTELSRKEGRDSKHHILTNGQRTKKAAVKDHGDSSPDLSPSGGCDPENRPRNPNLVSQENPNLHYAAYELTKDTLPYQDPARVDEFIAKLAAYHNVKQGELTCSSRADSAMVSAVYVFPDKKEIDVFSRLLQVACWYSDETPGYHLNFSQQQFFFELKDMRRGLQYRWIAERINGKILLYGTNAPIGVETSSACYQEYRNELMHINSINHKTKEI